MKEKLYIIIPVLNESKNLARLFASLREYIETATRFDTTIILVDDGSTDDTALLAQQYVGGLNFQLLQHQFNQGPGKAFATAFAWLAGHLHDDDWVLTLEGDNTSNLGILNQMLHRSEEGFDVVLASVYIYGGRITNTNLLRIALSNIANTFVKEFLGIHGIMTVSSFYRLHRASVIRKLQGVYGSGIIDRTGFECMVEMLIKLINLNTKISEVPLTLDTNLRAGKSKMRIVRTIRGYFALLRFIRQWKEMSQGINES